MEARFKSLDKSIWDSVKEEQVKLGYRREVIRLYYPIESVERMLKCEGAGNGSTLARKTAADTKSDITALGKRNGAEAGADESTGAGGEVTSSLLEEFRTLERDTLGDIRISCDGERYCFRLPEEASTYVHEHTPDSGFLYDFIEVIAKHGISIDDVKAVFCKYSNCVHFERLESEDFDYLIYFENGVPDDYRYCLTDEGHHVIYHRFTPEDYEALGIGR